jgi:peroxiredoxin Q/BCP
VNRRLTFGASLIVAAAGLVLGHTAAAGDLAVGDVAPSFTLNGSDGTTHSLDHYRGKSAVVIAWFPKAFTGG